MSLLSPSGVLPPRRFVLATAAVYVAIFFSQMLLGAPVIIHAGLWPFTVAQIFLIWAWYVLHVRRLRDAGDTAGLAVGVAAVYALMIVLLVLAMALLTAEDSGADNLKVGQGLVQMFAVVFFFSVLFKEFGDFGAASYWVIGFLSLMLLPVAIAIGFSCWTAARPSLAARP